ncbi:MAG: hypothetical protein LBQ75_03185, partial [Zoogloeaceae bacterium]|nr:hypothetical protein [Zoogloeaceae bacterium]
LPPPQTEEPPPSQAEELPSPQVEKLPPPQAEALPPPQAEELPSSQVEELPPPQAEALPSPQAEELPSPQAEELPSPQAEELPPSQTEELPPPQAEALPPPQAEELPPPQAEELPHTQAEELPPPQAEELPSTQSELLLSSQAELPATAVPEKKDPLTATLEATTDLLPLLGEKPREPRFSLQQRALWDAAVEAFALAWESHRSDFAAAATSGSTENEPSADWESLRRAIFRLLEGALPLEHPAPLHLAEALASALDELDVAPPTPRLLTALTACLELLQEKDFLEHEALDDRIAQLVSSLERRNEGTRSRTVDQLFAHEALEEIEQMRIAMDALPPDTEIIAESARNLQSLAEPLELSALALAASHFARLVIMLDPACLDDSPGRDDTLAWIADMETWINQISKGESPPPPARLNELQTRLEML